MFANAKNPDLMLGFENTDSSAAVVLDEWSALSVEERVEEAPFVSPGPMTRNRRKSVGAPSSAVKKTPARASRKVSPTKEEAIEPAAQEVARPACRALCRWPLSVLRTPEPMLAGRLLFPGPLPFSPPSSPLHPPGAAVGGTGYVTCECFALHRRVASAHLGARCTPRLHHLEHQAQVPVGCGWGSLSARRRRCSHPWGCGGRSCPKRECSGA
jgi:hypothetical protein